MDQIWTQKMGQKGTKNRPKNLLKIGKKGPTLGTQKLSKNRDQK